MTGTIASFVVVLLILIGIVFLQVFLSKKENKWFGLILPGVSVGCALLMVFGLAAYIASGWDMIGAILATFLVGNIPTAILLVIYFVCREKYKKREQLKKMNVQDL